MSSLLKTIAANIRHYREQKGWTQTQLARAVRRQQSTISGIESASARPGLALLEDIAASLEIAPWQLIVEGVHRRELRHAPREVLRLLRLLQSSDPERARLGGELTRLVGSHIDFVEKSQRRRGQRVKR